MSAPLRETAPIKSSAKPQSEPPSSADASAAATAAPSAQASTAPSRQLSPRTEKALRESLLSLSVSAGGAEPGRAREVSRHDSDPLKSDAAGPATLDDDLLKLLQEWDLEDAADTLAAAGFRSIPRLRKLTEEDVLRLGLTEFDTQELKKLLGELKTDHLQMVPFLLSLASLVTLPLLSSTTMELLLHTLRSTSYY